MQDVAPSGNTLHDQNLVCGGYVEEVGEVVLQAVYDVRGNPAAMAVLCQSPAQVSIGAQKLEHGRLADMLYSQSGIVIVLQCLRGGSKNI